MTHDTATRWPGWRTASATCLALIAGFGLASALDHWGWTVRSNAWHETDVYWAVMSLGKIQVWVVIAAALVLIDSGRLGTDGLRLTWSRGPYLLASVAASGALAEGLKLVLRRSRPRDLDGYYEWHAWSEQLPSGHFGLPSSHVAVACAGLFVLWRFSPRSRPLLALGVVAIGYVRVAPGQHFLSDVYAGAVLGWFVPWVIAVAHANSGRRLADRRAGALVSTGSGA